MTINENQSQSGGISFSEVAYDSERIFDTGEIFERPY